MATVQQYTERQREERQQRWRDELADVRARIKDLLDAGAQDHDPPLIRLREQRDKLKERIGARESQLAERDALNAEAEAMAGDPDKLAGLISRDGFGLDDPAA